MDEVKVEQADVERAEEWARDWRNCAGEITALYEAFARHRLASQPPVSDDLVERVERAVSVCPQCEGEGSYADGLDEAACTTTCTRCDGNGWIADARAIIPIVREDEREACAKVAETKFADHGWDAPYRNAGLSIATAIRERNGSD